MVTGGASGLGLETSRALVAAGARVTLAVRNLAQGRASAAAFRAEYPQAHVSVAQLDLGDLGSVRRFASDWLGAGTALHILVNNAAIMACPLQYTVQGWEAQFATNPMGHFALSTGLLPALQQAAASSGNARVVCLSSTGHKITGVWAATAPELKGHGGLYLEDCNQGLPAEPSNRISGYSPHIVDTDAARRLWAVSEALLAAA